MAPDFCVPANDIYLARLLQKSLETVETFHPVPKG